MTVVHQCRLQRCCSKAMVQPIDGLGGGSISSKLQQRDVLARYMQ